VHVRDLRATHLHLFDIDHERFTYDLQGLRAKPTGVEPARRAVERRRPRFQSRPTGSPPDADVKRVRAESKGYDLKKYIGVHSCTS